MRIIRWLLVFLLLLLLSIIWLQIFPEGPMMSAHTLFPTMLVGQYHLANAYWAAALFGWSIISIFILCLYLGTYNRANHKSIGQWLATGYALYSLTYVLMILADLKCVNEGATKYFLGFPPPTAWMIYGMWFVPLLFSILFVRKYNSWVISPDDLKTFEKILQDRKQRMGPGQLENP